jgi:hypothetical protein
MPRWTIPEPIPIDWTMRDVSTARIAVRELDDGREQRTIEHAPLVGVRPHMMLWFLHHIDQHLEWRGMKMLAYRYWHPTDHIFFKIIGTPGPGCRFHVVEAFQANPKYLIDITFDVPKLDLTGFRLEVRRLGQVIMSMDEAFEETPEGMRYTVTLTLGSTVPVLSTITRLVREHILSVKLGAWYRHNVEEVGNLPHFLPELYAAHVGKTA